MIPRTIHQIWIGPKPPPLALMQTWADMNPSFEVRLWRSEKGFRNQAAIDAMRDWNGKADLMRYEILLEHGGLHIDADSEALRPLGDEVLVHESWATYENELACPGLITGAFMGCVPGSKFMAELVEKAPDRNLDIGLLAAWRSVGPELVTEVAKDHPELHVYPSNAFNPEHHTGEKGLGDVVPYGRHLWGNTKKAYGKDPHFR
jgi:mannosyltransferase OCH1-like enzyme